MNNPKDTNNPVTDLSPQLNAEQLSQYLTERALNKSAHYPGCYKVHLECANRVIDEATITIRCSAFCQCGDEDARLDPVWEPCYKCKWLESLGLQTEENR